VSVGQILAKKLRVFWFQPNNSFTKKLRRSLTLNLDPTDWF
jgi:hypothetical protein